MKNYFEIYGVTNSMGKPIRNRPRHVPEGVYGLLSDEFYTNNPMCACNPRVRSMFSLLVIQLYEHKKNLACYYYF